MVRPMTCPICGKPVPTTAEAETTTPFCSARCKQIDFFRWNDGRYAIIEPLDPAKHLPAELIDELENELADE